MVAIPMDWLRGRETGRLLSIWRLSGGLNLANFSFLAGHPIWRQLGADLARSNLAKVWPIWRDFLRLEIAWLNLSGEMPNLALN